jgi:uncharacterized membrane protein
MWPASIIVIAGLAGVLISIALELGLLAVIVSLIVTGLGCLGVLANLHSH